MIDFNTSKTAVKGFSVGLMGKDLGVVPFRIDPIPFPVRGLTGVEDGWGNRKRSENFLLFGPAKCRFSTVSSPSSC